MLDPLKRYQMVKQKNMEVHIQSHDTYCPDEASMGEGNPQAILDRGEPMSMPPLLLIQGTSDNIVPRAMTDRFAETYRTKGGDVSLRKFDGQPHTFITNEPCIPASVEAIKTIERFIFQQARIPR